MKRKILGLLCTFVFAISSLYSQVGSNPEEEFYEEALGWNLKGYVSDLPLLKPYPVWKVQEIIDSVIEKGEDFEVSKAKFYKAKYFGKPVNLDISYFLMAKNATDADESESNTQRFVSEISSTLSSDNQFGKYFSFSSKNDFKHRTTENSIYSVSPRFSTEAQESTVDLFTISCDDFDFVMDLNDVVYFGNNKVYGSFGFNKLGFGIFPDDDLILNPTSKQLLNGAFNFCGDFLVYSQVLALAGSSSYEDPSEYMLNKLLFFHSLKLPFFDRKLNVSFYESCMYGNYFYPSYLMPVPYFIMGNVDGFNVNLLTGLNFDFRPRPNISIVFDALLDDLKPKKILKLKPEEAAIRMGLKTGFVYTPVKSRCSFITLNYTMSTPYTYTKYNEMDTKWNYLDYSDFGENLGTALPPNSDRVNFKVCFKPLYNLKITSAVSFIRHANSYESVDDEDILDASKNGYFGHVQDGSYHMDSGDFDQAVDFTDFLKQNHKMYVFQQSIGAMYELKRTKYGLISINANYTFEYVKNDGVDNPIYNGVLTSEQDVQESRKNWSKKLKDHYNQYFTVGFNINF